MERIGRYEIVEEIGRGGFGRVYRAYDPSMKSEVAIKVMSHVDDPEMLARFRGEAAAARKLRHESIVTIYDVGEDRGVPYIVMEYLKGMDLQEIRNQCKPLTPVEKVRILSQVAAGLQVAHENGIIHRDVKPANIMVLKDGSVKIMDFGIARLTRDAANLTRTGVVVGTLQYIPPEQFEGHPADTLADLWAFGVIAFQLFSGRHPFEAPETMQVIYNITSLRIPDLRQLNPELPEELCQVVHKLLQRERSDRYQSFDDVRIDLNPILETLEAQEANRLVDDARVIAARGDLTAAHQIVRQVLERYPSNTQAKQIRDQIVTQIRAGETSRQVEELLKKGDQNLSAGQYEEALGSYSQACKLNPSSATARMRWERAQKIAERARRIREAIKDARSRLAAGAAKAAEEILAGVLAEDPDDSEASGLLQVAQKERAHQEDSARANAILQSRYLSSQRQFAEAKAVLDDCARQIGDHGDLQTATEEVRRAESAAAEEARVEAAMAAAGEHVRNGDSAAASAVLAPLAAEFPANVDLRDLLKFVAEEEARTRRVAEQRAAQERAATSRPPSAKVPTAKPDRATITHRALEMSRELERGGQISEAIHILEVALSRFPDASELEQERLRLSTPAPPPIEWGPGAAPAAAAAAALAPAPAAPAEVPTAAAPQVSSPEPRPTVDRFPHLALSRRWLWPVLAGVVTVGAGLAYWQFTKSPRVVPASQRKTAVATPPSPAQPESSPPELKPTEVSPADEPGKNGQTGEPVLASLLPHRVNFAFKKGDAKPGPMTLTVNRSPLQAVVKEPGSWLSAEASNGHLVLELKPAAAALSPGEYHQTVQVTSNVDSASLDVTLAVAADAKSDTAQSHATPSAKTTMAIPKPSDAVPASASAGKKQYSGPKQGAGTWVGNLAPGGRLVLGGSEVLEGGGSYYGKEIPPSDVDVSVSQRGLDVHTLPPTSAWRVVIVNSSGAPLSQINITWRVK